jgi:(2R)-3-sulfolactate dehydrogenase (NADP+)
MRPSSCACSDSPASVTKVVPTGKAPPSIGLFVLAIDAEAAAPGFTRRLEEQVERLSALGVHIPGQTARSDSELHLSEETMAAIRACLPGL